MIRTLKKYVTACFLLSIVFAASTPASATMQFNPWGFIWYDEPTDDCGGFENMCYDYCGGGDRAFSCNYEGDPPMSWGYCDCA